MATNQSFVVVTSAQTIPRLSAAYFSTTWGSSTGEQSEVVGFDFLGNNDGRTYHFILMEKPKGGIAAVVGLIGFF